MFLDAWSAHIAGCFTIQQGLGGAGSAARASTGTAPKDACAAIRGSDEAEQRPTKNAAITMPISTPPVPSSDDTGTATGALSDRLPSASRSTSTDRPEGGG